MLPRPFCWLWGDLSSEEVKKYGLLSLTFLFVIGSYWLLRPLKDSIFINIVGVAYQPRAKMFSLCVLVPLILLYSKLVDLFDKHTLFYIFGSLYAAGFTLVAYFLSHPIIGLANTAVSPYRIFGWIVYVMIENFGSLMVALFWSFVTSSTDSKSAKRGFPLIISGAQFGSIMGPTLVSKLARSVGIPTLALLSVGGICMIMLMVALFMRVVPRTLSGAEEEMIQKPKTGMIEGIRLILSRPYILGIFGIATLYEIVGTIIDYQMKVLAASTYTTPEAYAEFMAHFGIATNALALTLALFGTSYFMRRFGLTFCLLLFPLSVAAVVGYVYIYPTLWMVFAGMVAIKGLSYGLNNPAKEMMYIPTSKDVRFKAKGWIDMFGNRSAKATGSVVNDGLKGFANFLGYGTIVSFGVVAIWMSIAALVGTRFNTLTKENKIIE